MTDKIKFAIAGRLAYRSGLWEKYTPDGSDKGSYQCSLFIPKEDFAKDARAAELRKKIVDAGVAKWGEGAVRDGKPTFRTPIVDGDAEAQKAEDNGKTNAGWKRGNILIKAKQQFNAPRILAPDGEAIIDPESPEAQNIIFAGQNVVLLASLYLYAHRDGGRGVSFIFEGLKAIGGGEPVSADPAARDDNIDDELNKVAAALIVDTGVSAAAPSPAPAPAKQDEDEIPW